MEQVMERITKEPQIRNARAELQVIFYGNIESLNLNLGPRNTSDNENEGVPKEALNHEYFVLNLVHETDYDRDIIKGSMRPLRRKTTILKVFQARESVRSSTFMEVMDNYPFNFFLVICSIFSRIYPKF